jgi:predicted RNase H-like HicB family nuclease
VYLPASGGGYIAWISEAIGVHTQGETIEETRANLLEVVRDMLAESPKQFGVEPTEPVPPGAFLETMFVVIPV